MTHDVVVSYYGPSGELYQRRLGIPGAESAAVAAGRAFDVIARGFPEARLDEATVYELGDDPPARFRPRELPRFEAIPK